MISIDSYAYSNKLRTVNPLEKLVFAMATMIICLCSRSNFTLILVFLLMAGSLILKAGIPVGYFLRLISLPCSFIFMGILTIAFSASKQPDGFLFSFHVFGHIVGSRTGDLLTALHIFLTSMASVSCLYFLSLTTPMTEIMTVLKRLKVPVLFLELMGLMYRFIFVLMRTSGAIYTSQSSRLGYASLRNSFKSSGILVSSLFVRALARSQALTTALVSRGYTSEIKVLEQKYPVSKLNYCLILGIELILITLNLSLGGKY